MTDLAAAIATLGGVRQIFHFDAYGNAIGFNPAQAATAYLYSGEQFDSRIGQQYLRQRYYDPATGRFNRLDPFFGNLNDPQSFHKYLYTHADPVNGWDPTGKFLGLSGLGVVGKIVVVAIAIAVPVLAFSYRAGLFNGLFNSHLKNDPVKAPTAGWSQLNVPVRVVRVMQSMPPDIVPTV